MVFLYLAAKKTILIILIFSCENIWVMKKDVKIPGEEKNLYCKSHSCHDG